METKKKVMIGVAAAALVTLATVLSITQGSARGLEVRVEAIGREDLVEIVTASGNIRPVGMVEMSSDVSAKVAELFVEEGDDVVRGQTLLRLERDQYEANVQRARAGLAQTRSQEAQAEANLVRAARNLERFQQLRARDSLLVSRQQLEDAQTDVDVQAALRESARHGVAQAQAALDEAEDQLAKTVFTAPRDGKVTRLNVEEGETVIIGTMNNPGSLVLTISDLSVIEIVVQVDETSVSRISLGDSASIRIDAFPDEELVGRVTQIGTSAITPPSAQASGGQQAAIDFEVVLTLDPTDLPLRPDLSATADIVVERREKALAVPIIAMTVREQDVDGNEGPDDAGEREDVEGVFLVRDGTVTFTAVEVGIAGQEHFEVLSGLSEGDSVVAGPYQRIRQLRDGDAVRAEGPGGESES